MPLEELPHFERKQASAPSQGQLPLSCLLISENLRMNEDQCTGAFTPGLYDLFVRPEEESFEIACKSAAMNKFLRAPIV